MHNIEEYDTGYIHGDTWHGMAQYIVLDGAPTIDNVRETFNYPVTIEQTYLKNGQRVVGSNAIVRTDVDVILVPSVGDRFTLMDTNHLIDIIETDILTPHPELEIESVGTLKNGATSFINIKVREFAVKGDQSSTMSKLCYVNPLGDGAYKCFAHNVRIVCDNTLKAAEAQGAANSSINKISHTQLAVGHVERAMLDVVRLNLGIDTEIKKLNKLASIQFNTNTTDIVMDKLFPVPEKESKMQTRVLNIRESILNNYDHNYSIDLDTRHSAYGLLNAITYFYDHQSLSRKDAIGINRKWDGLVGVRANKKLLAYNTLLQMAA